MGQSHSCSMASKKMVDRIRLSVGCNDGETANFSVMVDGVFEMNLQAQCCKGLGTSCLSDVDIYPRAASSVTIKMNSGGGFDGKVSLHKVRFFYR